MIERARHPRPTVLIIAGDHAFASRCQCDLEARGHRVWVSSGWWLGVHLAGVEEPDLIVLDDGLTDLDGLSVLALLKAHPSTARIPVVVAASARGEQVRDRALRLGALDVRLKAQLGGAGLEGYLGALARPAGFGRPGKAAAF